MWERANPRRGYPWEFPFELLAQDRPWPQSYLHKTLLMRAECQNTKSPPHLQVKRLTCESFMHVLHVRLAPRRRRHVYLSSVRECAITALLELSLYSKVNWLPFFGAIKRRASTFRWRWRFVNILATGRRTFSSRSCILAARRRIGLGSPSTSSLLPWTEIAMFFTFIWFM
jgi:hypothetical protein